MTRRLLELLGKSVSSSCGPIGFGVLFLKLLLVSSPIKVPILNTLPPSSVAELSLKVLLSMSSVALSL